MGVGARCILLSPCYGCGKHGIEDSHFGAGGEDTSKNSSVAVEGSRTPYWERFVIEFLSAGQTQLMPRHVRDRACRLPRASQARALHGKGFQNTDDHFMIPPVYITLPMPL